LVSSIACEEKGVRIDESEKWRETKERKKEGRKKGSEKRNARENVFLSHGERFLNDMNILHQKSKVALLLITGFS
jgi:hypothetical protein